MSASAGYQVYGESAAAERERRALEYMPLVHHVLARLPVALPPHLDREDLLSAGLCGLVQAARSYDPSLGASFKSHAYSRVRGAILDELRRADPIPRQKRDRVRALEAAIARLTSEAGYPPDLPTLARALEITQEEVDELLALSRHATTPVSLDAAASDGEEGGTLHDRVAGRDETPIELVDRREQMRALAGALRELPPREREVIGLYYHDGLLLREIGEVLGVTESRVCQLMARATYLLRQSLQRSGFEVPLDEPKQGKKAARAASKRGSK